MENYLVIDFGTSSCRASLIGEDGRMLGSARVANTGVCCSLPAVPGAVEIDCETAWSTVKAAVLSLRSSLAEIEPRAIAVTAMLGYLLLDDRGRPVRPAFAYMDTRATVEADQLRRRLPELQCLTGRRTSAELLLPKLLWLERHEPETLRRTSRILGFKDWINGRLIGGTLASSDFAHLNYTGLVSWRQSEPLEELAVAAGLPAGFVSNRLPSAVPAFAIAGELGASAGSDLGFASGVPVVVGSSDGTTAMYGGGVCLPGTAACVSGTTDVLMQAVDPGLIGDGQIPVALSVNTGMEDEYALAGGATGTSAGMLTHLAALSGVPAAELGALLERETAAIPPGADGLLVVPGLAGERSPYWAESLRGCVFGLRAGHGRGHLFRAAMEASAFRLRRIVAELQHLGARPTRLLLAGGGASFPIWNQIRADVVGLPVETVSQVETSSLGAALFARKALGGTSSLGDLSTAWTASSRRWNPDRSRSALYTDAASRFEQLVRFLSEMAVDNREIGRTGEWK